MRNVVLICWLFFASKLFAVEVIDAKTYAKAWQRLCTDESRLKSFLRSMPKGADLHLHASGAIRTEDLMEMAAKHHYCISKDLSLIQGANNCQDFSDFIRDPKQRFQVLDAWSMQNSLEQKPMARAAHFFSTFPKFDKMVKAHWPEVIAKVLGQAEKERILYLEIMLSMQGNKPRANSQDFRKRVDVKDFINDNILRFQQLKSEVARLKPDVKTDYALILEIKRNQNLSQFKLDAWEVFAIANAVPDIVGINLVQPEYAAHAKRDFVSQLQWLRRLKQAFPHRPLVLHAGELPLAFTKGQTSRHIALTLQEAKPRRIGHGVSILSEENYPATLASMRKQDIAVEINLTSNDQILDIRGSAHPLRAYLSSQVPVVLSSDDPGVSRNALSHEYFRAVQEHHLDFSTLLQLNRNSLTYSLLPGASLWQKGNSTKPVLACRRLTSKSCLDYIRHQPKAQAQWHLEQELSAYLNHHLDIL